MFITLIRTVVLYIVVILAIRIMGKRQIGDMQPGELVITILISEIAAIPIQDLNQPILTGIVAVFTLVFLEISVSVIAMKIQPLRKLLYGTSAIVIKNGIINQKLLKKLRITSMDLIEVLRNQQVFDITQVSYAILETNGQLSVMMKPEYQNATVNDLNNIKSESKLPLLIVCDGKLQKNTIQNNGLKKEKIFTELKIRKIDIKKVFIMTYDGDNYKIIKKEENK